MHDPRLLPYAATWPTLGRRVFVADTARVIGDVVLGDETSVWFGSVIRGDVHHIRVGARVNVQDLSVIHVTTGVHPTVVEDDVTIGHRATLHGCTVRRAALIGMGATVMDAAEVGELAMVGAGALVTPGTVVAPRTLWVGSPARYKRPLTEAEVAHLSTSAAHYVTIAAAYLGAGAGDGGPA
jgi:carbonic anhydrase/acetyltransferase-like protein (isoleucine patch superfamily)